MAISRSMEHATPNGGTRSEIFFQNSKGEAVDESEATQVEVVEYNREGEAIHRTYATLGGQKPAEA